jgi:hypothetical protein
MAMDAERLAGLMMDRVEVISESVRDGSHPDPTIDNIRLDVFKAMASAIIDEITTYAEVSTTVSTTVATTGTAAAQTGTGTGTGTGVID